MEGNFDDLKELKRLLAGGSSAYVENILKEEIAKLEAKLGQEEKAVAAEAPAAEAPKAPARRYTSIESYAFIDSREKATIRIKDIRALEQAEIDFLPEEHAFTICIIREMQNLPNLKLTVSPIKKIVPEKCKYSVKRETLTITLTKKKESTWMKLKKTIKSTPKKEEKKDSAKDSNPSGALMDMMKKMYDEGDDEMKRTISKAMWEAQHKKPDEKDDLKM